MVEFSKNEIHIIKNLKIYRIIALVSMLSGAFGVPFGFYALFFSYEKHKLNISLIAGSAVISAMGYLMWNFLGVIKKHVKLSEEKA